MNISLTYDSILYLLISQLFFAAIQHIIGVIKIFIDFGIGNLYFFIYKKRASGRISEIFSNVIRPILISVIFIVMGLIISIILYTNKCKQNEKKKEKIKGEIKKDISKENVIKLLKAYSDYLEIKKD
jgi:predicted histidine transporter YuiF (NhaC family)